MRAIGLTPVQVTVLLVIAAGYGRRLPEHWLRRIVIVGGTVVAVILLVD